MIIGSIILSELLAEEVNDIFYFSIVNSYVNKNSKKEFIKILKIYGYNIILIPILSSSGQICVQAKDDFSTFKYLVEMISFNNSYIIVDIKIIKKTTTYDLFLYYSRYQNY